MNYKIEIEYDGTNYNGWQRLGKDSGAITIQGTIESALEDIFSEFISINGSGRTDSGVHAICQTASFTAPKTDVHRLRASLNEILPNDIRILNCDSVPASFHARKSALSKTYAYRIHTGERRVFSRKYMAQHDERLDTELMEKYSKRFIGTHDFVKFSSLKDGEKDTIRTIYSVDVNEKDDGCGGQNIEIIYTGNGFLYNMVRILTGTLVEIGEKNKNIIKNFDEEKNVNSLVSGRMMPPEGLFLKKVSY